MPVVSASVSGEPGEQVQGGLLGELGQQRGDLVEGLAAPGAGAAGRRRSRGGRGHVPGR